MKEYIYNKSNITLQLVNYVEKNIFPQYDLNEASHRINHILNVINKSLNISKNYTVNLNIVYIIAAYHDIGHHIDKDNHEKISAQMMMEDEQFENFKKELIDLLNNKPKFFSKVNSIIKDLDNF